MAAAEHPPRPSARADDVFRISQVRRRGPVRRWFLAHPRAMDAVVAAWFGLPSLVTVAELRHTTRPLDVVDPAAAPWILLALSTVSTAALLLRRQHPLAVLAVTVGSAVVVTALLGNTYGHEFAVCFAAYAVASQRPPGTAWLSNLAAIALGAGTVMLAGDSSSIDPGVEGVSEPLPPLLGLGIAATFLALVVMVAHAIGMSVRARREHERALVDRANRIVLERDQREQLAAAAERARIAREMHDVVAHSLSVMVALADGATASLDKQPERSRRALEELASTGRDALTEMRSILGVLRTESTGAAAGTGSTAEDPPFEGAAPLAPTSGDLDELLARFRAAGLPVERVQSGPPLPEHPRLLMTVYRVVQESLTNVLRYASGATTVRVAIATEEDVVTVTVTNDAGSGAVQPGSGHGLLGLRERVGAFGGSVTAGPVDDGWRVHATIPVPPEGR
ncbi:MAG TPA: histidine kinase [Actinotalea caeni]|uniref:sensor histidine kinase n=1 Tax=Actinotalea caeni TaxID=1348467 RepID=UPI002B4AB3AF|nr:histidine kinase [Actinotalea caeni]HLV55188.1 histidine kinase [Actinotalea caeni]